MTAMRSFLSRVRTSRAPRRPGLAVAERFRCDVERLGGIELPLPPAPAGARQIDVLLRLREPRLSRHLSWTIDGSSAEGVAPLTFAPLDVPAGALLDLAVAFDANAFSTDAVWRAFDEMADDARAPIVVTCLPAEAAADPRPTVDRFWCDANGAFIEGRVGVPAGAITKARLVAGDDSAPADIRPSGAGAARFTGYLPWRAGTPVWLVLDQDGAASTHPLTLPRGPLEPIRWKGRDEWDATLADAMEVDKADESPAAVSFKHFVRSCDAPEMTVAEVGGRVVGDASQAMKRFMPKAGRFISVDIHASEHVDVVGDAHYLDELLGAESIDAVFSLSVMEHLAYPWLFAAAVNRALKPGGLVFQSTPHTWPLHETPNDFWRFSDEALKILFGPQTGFEVIDSGMVNRIWLYPEERRGAFVDMPFNHGYGNAYIYARKVRTVEGDAVRWPVDKSGSDDLARKYPQADRSSRRTA